MNVDQTNEIDRQLPVGDEIFLDHVGHFVPDQEAATAALVRAGFTAAPASIQVNPDPAGGPPRKTGTGNVTAMLERGYVEVLFKTADTPLGREFDAALARYPGVQIAAFAVSDAAATHARLAAAGFRVQPLVAMQRPVTTATGAATAAFRIVRLVPGEMPEGRIQALTHHTEDAIWQPRWMSHRNGATHLLDICIAETDVAEAAGRFGRFLGGAPTQEEGRVTFELDRGRVHLVTTGVLAGLFPHLVVPALPFMAAYRIGVRSLETLEATLREGGLPFERRGGSIVAPFPEALGTGCWVFVEPTAARPWPLV